MKILIADDEPLIRRSLKRLFADHETIECENGKSAMEEWTHHKPDIVILDILMPELTGPQVVQEVSEELRNSTIVVLMSAYTGSDKDSEVNCDLFLKKPFDDIIQMKSQILGLIEK